MGQPLQQQQQPQLQQQQISLPNQITENTFAVGSNSMKTMNVSHVSPVTLQHRVPEDAKKVEDDVFVTIPMSKLQNILYQPGTSGSNQIAGNIEKTIETNASMPGNSQRKR